MGLSTGAARWTNRLLASVLLSTAALACDEADGNWPESLILCSVSWSGTLATSSSAFDVRACWNGRCTSDIPLQLAQEDGGSVEESPDTRCVPTTRGGPPSNCDPVPFTPAPGCGIGEIADLYSVHACVSASAGADFNITLTARRVGYPVGGDQLGLTIRTAAGDALTEANARVPRDDLVASSSGRCRDANLALDGSVRE